MTRRGLRPWLVLAHRWVGLVLALVLLSSGVTGAVLAFDDWLDAWLNPELFHAPPGPALPLDRLVAAAEAADPRAQVVRMNFPARPGDTFQMGVVARQGGELGYDQMFVDPAAAAVLGRRDSGACCINRVALMPFIFRLHETLLLGDAGLWVMGCVAMLWTVDCVVGLLLTFPRGRPFLAHWRTAWLVKRTRNSFRLTLDVHRAGGLWCWVLLLVVAISGLALTLPQVFQPMVKAVLPVSAPPAPPAKPVGATVGFSAALAAAGAALPGKQAAFAWHVPGAGYGFLMADDAARLWGGLGPYDVDVAADGRLLSVTRAGSGRAGDTVLALQYGLHTGRLAGLTGRIVVCVLGVMVAVLSVTGPWLWWRKRRGPARRPAKAAKSAGALTS